MCHYTIGGFPSPKIPINNAGSTICPRYHQPCPRQDIPLGFIPHDDRDPPTQSNMSYKTTAGGSGVPPHNVSSFPFLFLFTSVDIKYQKDTHLYHILYIGNAFNIQYSIYRVSKRCQKSWVKRRCIELHFQIKFAHQSLFPIYQGFHFNSGKDLLVAVCVILAKHDTL